MESGEVLCRDCKISMSFYKFIPLRPGAADEKIVAVYDCPQCGLAQIVDKENAAHVKSSQTKKRFRKKSY